MLTAAILLLLPLFIAGLIHAFFNKPANKLNNKHFCDETHIEEVKNNHTQTKPKPQPQPKPNSTQVHRSELNRVFATFDKNNDGFISKQELKESFKNIGIHMTEAEIAETVEKLDSNGDGSIDMDEFCGLFGSFVGNKEKKEVEESDDGESDLKEAFDVFDGDKDGLITVEELGMVLSSLGLKEGMRLETCKEMINKVDIDGDGMVNFDEFKKMMKSGGNLLATIS